MILLYCTLSVFFADVVMFSKAFFLIFANHGFKFASVFYEAVFSDLNKQALNIAAFLIKHEGGVA